MHFEAFQEGFGRFGGGFGEGFGGTFVTIFRFGSENRDIAKISLPPRREHDFQGVAPLKHSKKSLNKQ